MDGYGFTLTQREHTVRNLLDRRIPRTKLDELLSRGYVNTPASTKYHGAYPGGLFDHSFEVYHQLNYLAKTQVNINGGRNE